MSISSLTICNSALLKVGADTISNLAGTDRAAVVCTALYAYLRDEVMANAPWRFALKRVVLAANNTTPVFEYTYQFDIPTDCLRLLRTDDDSIDWVVEGNQILSNESSLNMKYIYQNTTESSWDSRFAETMAWRMAMELAISLTQSVPMFQAAEKSYMDALKQARALNAVVGKIPPLEADIWSKARRGYKYWRASAGQTT